MIVRDAIPDDALAIARVRVDTWRVAYEGLVPADVLGGLDADGEAAGHRSRLEAPRTPGRRELVAEADDGIVGWTAVGPSQDAAGCGELYALYVLPGHWRTRVGHALIDAATAALRDAGFAHAVLWMLDGNDRAGRFYEARGWRLDGATKTDPGPGGTPTDWVAFEVRRSIDLSPTA